MTTELETGNNKLPVRSSLALVSLILGIATLFLFVLSGIPAIGLGVMALIRIINSDGKLKGMGFAIAGIVSGFLFMIISPLVFLLLISPLFRVKDHPLQIRQEYQFLCIEVALASFKMDSGVYPQSFDNPGNAASDKNTNQKNYCGAQKLAEALVGQDLLGFHPDSKFRFDGKDDSGKSLYIAQTVRERKGPYIDIEKSSIFQLKDIFKDVGTFDGNSYVICDVHMKERHSGMKTGMPVLYYRANTSGKTMDGSVSSDQRIYNAQDNMSLIRMASANGGQHPLVEEDGKLFYDKTSKMIQSETAAQNQRHHVDSYVLISAGPDGSYGTSDDEFNYDGNLGDR